MILAGPYMRKSPEITLSCFPSREIVNLIDRERERSECQRIPPRPVSACYSPIISPKTPKNPADTPENIPIFPLDLEASDLREASGSPRASDLQSFGPRGLGVFVDGTTERRNNRIIEKDPPRISTGIVQR